MQTPAATWLGGKDERPSKGEQTLEVLVVGQSFDLTNMYRGLSHMVCTGHEIAATGTHIAQHNNKVLSTKFEPHIYYIRFRIKQKGTLLFLEDSNVKLCSKHWRYDLAITENVKKQESNDFNHCNSLIKRNLVKHNQKCQSFDTKKPGGKTQYDLYKFDKHEEHSNLKQCCCKTGSVNMRNNYKMFVGLSSSSKDSKKYASLPYHKLEGESIAYGFSSC